MNPLIAGQVLTFAAIIVGFVFQFITTERKRKWDVEDRELIARRLVGTTAAIAKEAVVVNGNAAVLLAQQTEEATQRLEKLILMVAGSGKREAEAGSGSGKRKRKRKREAGSVMSGKG